MSTYGVNCGPTNKIQWCIHIPQYHILLARSNAYLWLWWHHGYYPLCYFTSKHWQFLPHTLHKFAHIVTLQFTLSLTRQIWNYFNKWACISISSPLVSWGLLSKLHWQFWNLSNANVQLHNMFFRCRCLVCCLFVRSPCSSVRCSTSVLVHQ